MEWTVSVINEDRETKNFHLEAADAHAAIVLGTIEAVNSGFCQEHEGAQVSALYAGVLSTMPRKR